VKRYGSLTILPNLFINYNHRNIIMSAKSPTLEKSNSTAPIVHTEQASATKSQAGAPAIISPNKDSKVAPDVAKAKRPSILIPQDKKQAAANQAAPPNDKNFDFTLNNGNQLEEIQEQLKEESNIIDEWDTKGAGNIKG
jgi:hypothetical protein